MNAADRWFAKVRPADDGSGCLLWTGGQSGSGYGTFFANGKLMPAHRWIMNRANGPIPPELKVDHLCRRPLCVRPLHLEVVTQSVNVLRGVRPAQIRAKATARTHCDHGHSFAGDNLYVWTSKKGRTSRFCRTCIADRNAATVAERREYQRSYMRKRRWPAKVEALAKTLCIANAVITTGLDSKGRLYGRIVGTLPVAAVGA